MLTIIAMSLVWIAFKGNPAPAIAQADEQAKQVVVTEWRVNRPLPVHISAVGRHSEWPDNDGRRREFPWEPLPTQSRN